MGQGQQQGRGTSNTEKRKVRDSGTEWDKVSNRGGELATLKRERSGKKEGKNHFYGRETGTWECQCVWDMSSVLGTWVVCMGHV